MISRFTLRTGRAEPSARNAELSAFGSKTGSKATNRAASVAMAGRRPDGLNISPGQMTARSESPDESNVPEQEVEHTKPGESSSRQSGRVQAYKGDSDDEESFQSTSTGSSVVDEDEERSDDSTGHHNLGRNASDHLEFAQELDRDPSSRDQVEEIAKISFGALAKAQSSLGKRKRNAEPSDSVQTLSSPNDQFQRSTADADAEALERKAGKKDARDFTRPSKHAPAEISSKKAVSRKRGVVPIPKREIRDPRFESLNGPLNNEKIKKNYAFLDTYRESEIAELKAGLRKTKDPTARETLKRALMSMESKKKTEELKEQRQGVLRKHRKEEREMVEKGKKPFYLKKGEIKQRALVERFERMKGKQVEKVIERRRRKQTAKERRGMPLERRG